MKPTAIRRTTIGVVLLAAADGIQMEYSGSWITFADSKRAASAAGQPRVIEIKAKKF
jgi:hypothetical protein